MNIEHSSQQIIDKIILYSGNGSVPLLKKFNINYISNILDRTKIESIDKVYKSKEDGFNLLEFVRFFLNVIQHEEVETLYLTMALVDFFKEISQLNGFKEKLMFVDITNYICNRILEKRTDSNQIQSKYISEYKRIDPSFKIKDYLVNPPKIYASKDETVYKLSLNKIKIDKTKHQSVVTNCYFSSSLNKVFTLDILSDSISVYNSSCSLVKKIKPNFSKIKKDIVVLSFAYSQRQERIGAVLKDFSMNFWDHSENFEFEKSISTASHCQQYQTNIWFFDYFNKWVTSDKTGFLYIWNLEKERPERKIKLEYEAKINDICIIDCINLIAVAQERKMESLLNLNKKEIDTDPPGITLYDFFKGQAVARVDLNIENRVPHTLQYSENYQVLLSAGYEKKISIYEINKMYLDTNLKGELTGHESLVTSFTLLRKSPMVVSADDKGKVKVWDLRNYKCIQTLDFRDKTNITKLLDMMPLGKIGVFGSRINFVEFDEKMQIQKRNQNKEKVYPQWIECDYTAHQLIVLTKKDLRIFDLKKGIIKCIYCEFHAEDQEITCFKYLQAVKKFLIGNEKGEIKLFCIRTGKLETKLIGHSSSVMFIEYDQQNKLFISMGQDSCIQIQKQLKVQVEDEEGENGMKCEWTKEKNLQQNTFLLRHIKNCFGGKEITVGAVSIYHGLIVVGSSERNLYVWDYEFAKLLIQISLPKEKDPGIEPTALTFINGYAILVIGTSTGQLFLLKILKMDYEYKLSLVAMYESGEKEPINNIYVDLLLKGYTEMKEKLIEAKLHLSYVSGVVETINVMNLLNKCAQEQSVVCKQNYNPERQLRENFTSEMQKQKYFSYTLDVRQVQQPRALVPTRYREVHKSAITTLNMIQFDSRYLLTASVDGRIKIWQNTVLLCDCNINLPLPYKWELKVEEKQKIKDKIMFALKIIQRIFLKYGSDISIGESKALKVRKLIDEITMVPPQHITEPTTTSTPTTPPSSQNIILFQDQFTKKDLHYDLVKKFNFTEIAGPTLRELQVQKKLDIIQKEWQTNKNKLEVDKARLLENIRQKAQKNEEKEQIMQFLEEKSYGIEPKKFEGNFVSSPYMKNLETRLNDICCDGEVKESIDDDKTQRNLNTFKNLKQNYKTLGQFSKTAQQRKFLPTRKLHTSKTPQRTFQTYFTRKQNDQTSNFFKSQPLFTSLKPSYTQKTYSSANTTTNNNFREILNKMNEKVRISKQGKFMESTMAESLPCSTRYGKPMTSYQSRRK